MSNILSYLTEASLILLILYTGYFFILRQKAAPVLIRAYLMSSLLLALSIPFIQIPLGIGLVSGASNLWAPASEAWNFLPELVVYANPDTEAPGPFAALKNVSPLYWLSCLYLAGFLVSILLSAIRLLKIRKLILQYSFTYSKDHSYKLAATNGEHPTFSFLHYIFWDNTASLKPEEERQILQHETAHVKFKHSIDLLCLELLTALFWFNPLIYLFRRSLQQAHEFQADQYALQSGEENSYLSLMVKQSFRQANIPLVSTFFQHNTLTRIRMIKTKPTHTLLRASFSIFLAATVFFVASCEDETTKLENDPQLSTEEPSANSSAELADNFSEASKEQARVNDQVFEVVEEQPHPAGGMDAFYAFVGNELQYPAQANRLGVEGSVYVQFIVTEQGNVEEVKVLKGIGAGCDAEAARVIKLSKWEPGRQKGRAVKVRMIMPISYRLSSL